MGITEWSQDLSCIIKYNSKFSYNISSYDTQQRTAFVCQNYLPLILFNQDCCYDSVGSMKEVKLYVGGWDSSISSIIEEQKIVLKLINKLTNIILI